MKLRQSFRQSLAESSCDGLRPVFSNFLCKKIVSSITFFTTGRRATMRHSAGDRRNEKSLLSLMLNL